MPDPQGTDELQFVEIEGVKYKANPDNLEEALKDEQDQPIPFEEEKESPKKEIEEEPQTRRSAKDFIIDRKDKKIKKLEKEKDRDEGDEFTPEGKQLIQARIDKAVKPVLNQVRGQSDMQELNEVLEKYGEPAKKLRKQIEKYMKHEGYVNTPVEFIFLGLAAKGIMKAEKKKAADEEAAASKTGGSQKRPKKIAKIPDVRNMTDKQIQELAHKVLSER